MKRLTALLLGLAPLAGCFPVRSEEFACVKDEDCSGGRRCDTGFCVISGEQGVDGEPMMNVDAAPSTTCATDWAMAPQLFDPCEIEAPGAEINLTETGGTGYVLDASSMTLKSPTNAEVSIAKSTVGGYLVVSTPKFTVGTGVVLRVIGSTPVVIAAWDTITVLGTIDAGSITAQTGAETDSPGAGAGVTTQCTLGAAAVAGNNNGSGGGAGGSFGAMGGAGGVGGDGGNSNGTGGVPGATKTPGMLSAGCPGGNGAATTGTPGAAGIGGGAIALVAQHQHTISGTVAAGGGGGHYGVGQSGNDAARAGGGGGGSGGMIALEAATMTITGTLTANGGGGGQGRDNDTDGDPGKNAARTALSVPGGAGDTDSGGFGGAGGSSASLATAGKRGNQTPNNNGDRGGGGGGGGGAGVITVHLTGGGSPTLPTTTVSPMPTTR